jgi:hypothetical protein
MGAGGIQCGVLTVENGSPDRAYLVWNDVSAIRNGVQTRAYKGDVRVLDKTDAVPEQPIEPGAKIAETVCPEIPATFVTAPRPATPWDALDVVYGLGVLVGNGVWKPTDDYAEMQIPDWKTRGFELVVPIRTSAGVSSARLDVTPDGIATDRVRSAG